MKKLVIFDLDGTLINSIADLAHSTNYALEQLNFPTHPVESYKFMVGNGINKLFERALPEGYKDETNILRVREVFLSHYDKNNVNESRPYPGMEALLEECQSEGIKLAVASNKYQSATEKIIRFFFPHITFEAVLGQRTNVPTKPDPTIVYDILEKTNIKSEDVLYVGDSGVDMQTAKNANLESCGVTWGFRPLEELVQNGPGHIADSAEELKKIIFS